MSWWLKKPRAVKCPQREEGYEDGHLCRRKYGHDGRHRCGACGVTW